MLPCVVLAVLVLLVHWPGGTGFKADDFPAIRYASDPANLLHDFVGPQYGLSFFLFYRPLITLSFGLDALLFGTEPFGFYLMNTLALLASVLLLYSILRELWPGRAGLVFALATAGLWIWHPSLVTSLRWVAGRVDTHAAVPLLLALRLHLASRRGGRRWPIWVAAVCALMSKESAVGLPLIALGLDLLDPRPSLRPAPALFGRALPALPLLLLIPIFFLWRKLFLGAFIGGYGFEAFRAFDPIGIVSGFWTSLGVAIAPGLAEPWRWLLAAALVPLAAFALLRPRHRLRPGLAGLVLVVAGTWGPLLQLLPSMQNEAIHRYLFLACVTMLAAWTSIAARLGGGSLAALILGLVPLFWFVPAHLEEQRRLRAHDDFNRSLVAAMHACDAILPAGEPVVLAGDAERANHPQRFLWGLGSVLKPPFRQTAREVATLRKLHRAARAVPVELAAFGLSGHVVVGEAASRLVQTAGAPWSVARPIGFDGTLRGEDFARVADPSTRIGLELGEGFTGEVAVLTSVGSLIVQPPAGAGILQIRDLFAANATFEVAGAALPLYQILINAMDLAPDSPIYLVWRETRGVVRNALGFTGEFTRRMLGR